MAPPPVFSNGFDGEAPRPDHRAQMVAYIKAHFSDLLGADAELLEAPGGLDALAAKLHAKARRGER